MRHLALLIIGFFSATVISGQDLEKPHEGHFSDVDTSDLFLLGTFHFKDAGLDGYKPKHDVDILSPKRQGELQDVLDQIRKFKPNKIAVEWKKSRQSSLDSLYNEYLAGRFELKSNEIYQIGFRMGKELGHKKLYAVDAPARNFDDYKTEEAYKEKEAYFTKKLGEEIVARDEMLHNKFMAMYAKEDEQKMQLTLLEQLLNENDPEGMRIGHGHYLIGNFKMNAGDDYFGADGAIWWYTRNLRIFANIVGITDPGKDKVFLLIGAGHLPILNFVSRSSPDYRVVTLQDLVQE
ncbi:DUF5694 domain-containing protein [Maribacter algicola]|uniref:DUF5694 domain-containing protein n=1 Tax=Meishania litoralis TaxID=3434685 RepID=A0ACC7LK20_9FLAO